VQAASVERLFVGLPVPEGLARALVALQPPPGTGIRLTRKEDLHLTLHFIGQAPVAPVVAALGAVRAAAFRLEPDKPGHFALRGGRKILWLGFRPEPALDALHAAVGDALRSTGFEPERRPWVPHLTLARLGPDAPAGIAERLDATCLPASDAAFVCDRFVLYASRTLAEGARYHVRGTFGLS